MGESQPDEVEDESLQRVKVCRGKLLQQFVDGLKLLLLLWQFYRKEKIHN